jgi:hypothetical protein
MPALITRLISAYGDPQSLIAKYVLLLKGVINNKHICIDLLVNIYTNNNLF